MEFNSNLHVGFDVLINHQLLGFFSFERIPFFTNHWQHSHLGHYQYLNGFNRGHRKPFNFSSIFSIDCGKWKWIFFIFSVVYLNIFLLVWNSETQASSFMIIIIFLDVTRRIKFPWSWAFTDTWEVIMVRRFLEISWESCFLSYS